MIEIRFYIGSDWTHKDIVIIIVIFFGVNTCFSVMMMLFQIIYLISRGITTNENIRNIKYEKNVFDEGCRKNWNVFWNEI